MKQVQYALTSLTADLPSRDFPSPKPYNKQSI